MLPTVEPAAQRAELENLVDERKGTEAVEERRHGAAHAEDARVDRDAEAVRRLLEDGRPRAFRVDLLFGSRGQRPVDPRVRLQIQK